MQRSTERILTTHTGSLPRPEALTLLYVQRARGEASIRRRLRGSVARRSAARSCAKQREAGIDVGNNGEQQREVVLPLSARPPDRARRQLATAGAAPTSTAIRQFKKS